MRYALLLLLLAGCISPPSAEQVIARYSPFCEKLGYAPDTDQWRSCIQSEVAQRRTAAAMYGAAAIGSRPKTCQPNGAGGATCF